MQVRGLCSGARCYATSIKERNSNWKGRQAINSQLQAAAIFHITSRAAWEEARETGSYRGDTLDSEGFIHCSLARQVVEVANARFRGQQGLVLLQIDSTRVVPEIKYEGAEEELFPHIYGPLDREAVITVYDFLPDKHGLFQLPAAVREQAGGERA
ncbi:MAG TPA: DUF952 domain-containing protein [Ktedonobacterales bacterium]